MKIKYILIITLAIFSLSVFTSNSFAQKTTASQQLAEKLSNPVANIISVPFQNNTVWGIGSLNGSMNVLNFQPVVPLSFGKKLNVINRLVLPMITQYNITGIAQKQNSLGDMQYSIFIAPVTGKLIWGVGPIMSIPTATNTMTGSGRFSVGPTGVFLIQSNGWTVGALINQIWSVGGNPDRGNQTQGYLQPFLAYSFKSGGGFALNAEMTQNWKIKRTQTYMDFIINGLTKLGKFPVQLAVGPRIPICAPSEFKGSFGVRAVATFVFPK